MPRISICLPIYNGAAFVEEALASIAAQTFSDYVVLASDNASTDHTADVLRRWADRIPMEIVTQAQTIPMQAHFDSLLDRVHTESYMLLCHDDFLASRNALVRAQAVLDSQAHVSAVYCDLAYVSERGRTIAHRRFGRSGEMNANDTGRQCLSTARNMFGIPLLIRTDALGQNRYDPQFRYVVDVDLSWTLSKTRPCWHIPEVLIANRYSGGNSTWSLLASAEDEFLRLAEKHGVQLSALERVRLKLRTWSVGRQRQLFGLYERMVTRFGRPSASAPDRCSI